MQQYADSLRNDSPNPELAELLTEADYDTIIESDKAAHNTIWQEATAAHGVRTTVAPPGTRTLVLEATFRPYMQLPFDQLKVFFSDINEKMKARCSVLVAELLPRTILYERSHQDADGRAVLETLIKLQNNWVRVHYFGQHMEASLELKKACDAAWKRKDGTNRIA